MTKQSYTWDVVTEYFNEHEKIVKIYKEQMYNCFRQEQKGGKMIKITKQEQEIKDCLIKLLQDYNGSWNDLKKEKRYKELMKYNKANKGEK